MICCAMLPKLKNKEETNAVAVKVKERNKRAGLVDYLITA